MGAMVNFLLDLKLTIVFRSWLMGIRFKSEN